MVDNNSVVVITGGAGGMGQACARRLGKSSPLLLVDINAASVEATAAQLRTEGYRVTAFGADLSAADNIAKLVEATKAIGPLKALVHTAGLSPTMADPKRIMEVNWVLTYQLAEAFFVLAQPGTCAVMIASTAGHMMPPNADVEAVLDNPMAADFWAKIEKFIPISGASYALSKRAVMRYCEHTVSRWGARGARIVTISPGIIATPMDKQELEQQPTMQSMLQMTPLQRQGTADDIAAGVEFLCSDAASYITGIDLRIDGGVIPVMLGR